MFQIQTLPSSEPNKKYDYQYFSYNYANFKPTLDHSSPYQYLAKLLPFSAEELKKITSINEYNTPLIQSKQYPNCYIKDEGRNPSGSFKDRESALTIPYYINEGFKKFVIVSSGNAALSASLYASMNKVKMACYVPHGTSKPKINLIKAYGGEIHYEGRYYEECYKKVLEKYENHPDCINITAGQQAIRDQGSKIIAYEIIRDLPDVEYIIIPAANGSLLYGIYHGLNEMLQMKMIKRIPKLICVQMAGGAPIHAAFQQNQELVELTDCEDSKAEGLIAMESYCSPKAIHALKASGGFTITVKEDELAPTMIRTIKEEGIIPEWTATPAFAALTNLIANNTLTLDSKIVLINSGNGLKEISEIVNS